MAELPAQPHDPFAILGPAEDDQTYAQTCWTGPGFVLEYQEGSVERHFRTRRADLSVAEVSEALGAYLDRNPAWRYAFEFDQVEVRPLGYRAGFWAGRRLGLLSRWLAG